MSTAKKKEGQTFESAMARIEQIAARMETGEFALEELVVMYEEGLGLIKYCSGRLDEAEKRLQTISRDSAGQPKGLVPVENADEIPPSTTGKASGSEEGSGSGEDSAVHLF